MLCHSCLSWFLGFHLVAAMTIGHPNHTPELRERIKSLWEEGKSAGVISRILDNGMSRNACIGVISRMKLAPRLLDRPAGGVIRQKSIAKPRPVLLAIVAKDMEQPPDEPFPIGIWNDFPAIGLCRWIAGDTRKEWRTCGFPVHPKSVYCKIHHSRCYVAPRPHK